jgi:tripeptide aminopeptidase
MSNLTSRILNLALDIQKIPAPTFYEAERAKFVRQRFIDEGLSDVEMDDSGNVYARLPGSLLGNAIVICAHLDTVFPSSVDLHVKREEGRISAPGIGDNSLGVAGLFGLVWGLSERKVALPGDLWLVANVCEEGLGNLRGIQAVVKHFGSNPTPPKTGSVPLAYIVLEGMPIGHIYHRGLGVRRYRVTIHTQGGHSWIDYGQPSAIHELTSLSTRIAALKLPDKPRTTLNIGVISGGSSINTIAAEAMLELDIRSEGPGALETLSAQVEKIIQTVNKPGVTAEVEIIGRRPFGELPVEHPLVKLAQDCVRSVGIEPRLDTGSTDANFPLSLGIPAVTLGLTSGGRAHTVHEFINTAPLEKGMEQLLQLVTRAWDSLGELK